LALRCRAADGRGDGTAGVHHAIEILGPTGFVLSPIDNLTVDVPKTWQNLEAFIEEWKSGWEKTPVLIC